MKKSPFVVGLIFLSSVCSQTDAQRTGTLLGPDPARIPDDYKMSDADRGRATTNAYAECLLKRNPRAVERAVALPPGIATGDAFAKLATDDCLDSGELRMPRSLLRGAAFVALYRRDYGRQSPLLIESAPDYAAGLPENEESRAAVALRRYASCVIRQDAEHSRQFVLASVASRSEQEAIVALTPSFNDCLSAGTTLHFSKAVMQGVLAEVLYRETAAPTPHDVAISKKK